MRWRSTTLHSKLFRRASLATTATIRLVVRLDSASPIPPSARRFTSGPRVSIGTFAAPHWRAARQRDHLWSALARGAKALGAARALSPARDHRSLARGGHFRRAHVGRWSDRPEQPRCGATFAARPKRVDRASAPVRPRASSRPPGDRSVARRPGFGSALSRDREPARAHGQRRTSCDVGEQRLASRRSARFLRAPLAHAP